MTLKKALQGISESELLYIGMETGGGFLVIARNRDIDLNDLGAKLSAANKAKIKSLKNARYASTSKRKAMRNYPTIVAEENLKLQVIEEKLKVFQHFEKIPMSNREVIDAYKRNADEHVGLALIIEGCENINGKWFIDDKGGL